MGQFFMLHEDVVWFFIDFVAVVYFYEYAKEMSLKHKTISQPIMYYICFKVFDDNIEFTKQISVVAWQ